MLTDFRALDRRIWVLAFARMVVTAGFSMVLPFLAIHLTVERKVTAFTVGLIWAVAGAIGAGMQWLAGEIADRVGRRPLLIWAMVLRAANLAGLGYAIGHEASIMTIALLTIGNAMLRSCFDPVCSAAVADLCPVERRVAAFSLQRVGINIGWAAGPAVAALLKNVPYGTLFYWSAPLTFVSALAVASIPETRTPREVHRLRLKDLLSFLDDLPFVRFLLATLAFFLLQVQLYQSLSIYAARHLGLDRGGIGHLYTLNGVIVVALQIPAAAAIRRFGTGTALVFGSIGYAIAYAACGLAVGEASLLVCVAAITLAEIMTSPAQQAAATSMAPAERIGAYAGLYGLCQVTGQSFGPLVGTGLLDILPDRLAWFALALFGVAAAVGYRKARPPRRASAPA